MQGDAQSQRDNSPMADLAGLRVLVVEDHDDFQYFLAFVLRYFGAEVRGAKSAEAIGALCAFQPDVIVAGIGLPGQDALIHSIRASRRSKAGRSPPSPWRRLGRPKTTRPSCLWASRLVCCSRPFPRSWRGQWRGSPGGLAKPRRHKLTPTGRPVWPPVRQTPTSLPAGVLRYNQPVADGHCRSGDLFSKQAAEKTWQRVPR